MHILNSEGCNIFGNLSEKVRTIDCQNKFYELKYLGQYIYLCMNVLYTWWDSSDSRASEFCSKDLIFIVFNGAFITKYYKAFRITKVIYSYLVSCCPISDLSGEGEPILGKP